MKGYDDEVPIEVKGWALTVLYRSISMTPNRMWQDWEPELKKLAMKDIELKAEEPRSGGGAPTFN